MALKGRTYLKGKFETGDIPTEQDYIDLLDSYRNFADDPDVKTWYLSTSGLDANVGSTKAKPFLNPQTAIDAAASGDKIEILDIGYSKSGAFAFSKDITIVGPAGYNPTNAASITGQFTITGGASLQFQNINLGGVSIISTDGDADISIYDSRLLLTAATANAIDLYLSNCEFDTSSEITLRSLIMRAVEGSGSKLNTEGVCTIHFSNWSTEIEVGTGGATNCNLRGAILGGALTVTGNLSNENSTIAGAEAVSGTTTLVSQVDKIEVPNTWYLNTNGDDSNSGNDKFPFENPQAAHDAAAEGDILFFQNRDYLSTQNVTVTKSLTLKGSIPANDNDIAAPFIGGTWDIASGKDLMVINLWIAATFTHPSASWFLQCTGCHLAFSALPTRKTKLIANDCLWELGNNHDLFSLVMKNTKATTTKTINIGKEFTLTEGSEFEGSIIAGIDTSALSTLKNSSIEGDVTVTGDLLNINGTVVGTETVSGTPTSRQAKVFDDSVGLGVKPINKLDVNGSTAIGSAYAGISTAPANGMIVQGDSGFGTTLPQRKMDIVGTAGETNGIQYRTSGTTLLIGEVFNKSSIFVGSGKEFTLFGGGAVAIRIYTNQFVSIGTGVPATRLHVNGAITQNELSADPSDPSEGSSVTWQSDGTGSGDDGDIMMKITAGGTTKTTTLVDFSAI